MGCKHLPNPGLQFSTHFQNLWLIFSKLETQNHKHKMHKSLPKANTTFKIVLSLSEIFVLHQNDTNTPSYDKIFLPTSKTQMCWTQNSPMIILSVGLRLLCFQCYTVAGCKCISTEIYINKHTQMQYSNTFFPICSILENVCCVCNTLHTQ